jgi:hypothetical protein
MADLKVALEELKEESDSGRLSGAIVAAPKPRRRALWLVALLVAITLGAATFWFLQPGDRVTQTSLIAVPLTSYAGYEESPSFSPDGNQVAFVWNGEKQDSQDLRQSRRLVS